MMNPIIRKCLGVVRKHLGIVALIGSAILLLGVVCWLWRTLGVQNAELRKDSGGYGAAGVYGDSFGYVNSLFSGLAFAGVVFAIILQTIELRHQRLEMEQMNKSAGLSASAHEQSIGLNALAALIQAYLEEYTTHRAHHDQEYLSTALLDHNKLSLTLRYKIDYAKYLMEKKFSDAYKENLGDLVFEGIPERRRSCWIKCLHEAQDLAFELGSLNWRGERIPHLVRDLNNLATLMAKSPDALGPETAKQHMRDIELAFNNIHHIYSIVFHPDFDDFDTGNIDEVNNSYDMMQKSLVYLSFALV